MELSTVNLDGYLLNVYYELKNNDIIIKSVEFLKSATNILGSLDKHTVGRIIEILNEDNPLLVDNDGEIITQPFFDMDMYESGHSNKDFS